MLILTLKLHGINFQIHLLLDQNLLVSLEIIMSGQ